MFEYILEIIHYGVIMLFGIYLSAAFLGIRMNRSNILKFLGVAVALGILNTISFLSGGVEFTEQIYPLIMHLPLILLFWKGYRYKLFPSALSVSIVYLCCQISNWIGVFFLNATEQQWVYYGTRIIVNILIFLLLMHFAAAAIAELLRKDTKDIVIFGLIPFVYYLYDYAVTVYTKLFYSAGEVVTEFLGFMLCISYVLFLILYFKQYEEKMETEQQNKTMELQRIQSEKEVERMKRSEYTAAILRHDMRHFLNDIAGFVENGEKEQTLSYIHEVIEKVDSTAGKKYCTNKIVNMILSSYENKMKEEQIDFTYSIRIPKKLEYADSDISSILSNALENAIHAVEELETGKRKIGLDMRTHNDKLLISIRNTYGKKPHMADGLPVSGEPGHGFGTQSIRYVTEKLKGNCQFGVDEKYFMLRIVL